MACNWRNRLVPRYCALVLVGLTTTTHAVELGDIAVHSYIGQPLVADIELDSFAPDEIDTVHVQMASADVYKGANVAMPAVLASLYLSVMRRDEHQFLHITSLRPVESDHVLLFLALTAGKRSIVRSATIWLVADPTPPPPPRPPPPPPPVPVPVIPTPIIVAPPTPVVARRPPISKAEAKICATLDAKNTALTGKIVDLEDKVKTLQEEVVVQPVTLPRAAPAPHIAAPVLAAKPVDKKVPHKKSSALMWSIIGAVLVLFAGATGAYFTIRKKAKAKGAGEAVEEKRGLIARLKERFKRKPKVEEAPAEEEPAAD